MCMRMCIFVCVCVCVCVRVYISIIDLRVFVCYKGDERAFRTMTCLSSAVETLFTRSTFVFVAAFPRFGVFFFPQMHYHVSSLLCRILFPKIHGISLPLLLPLCFDGNNSGCHARTPEHANKRAHIDRQTDIHTNRHTHTLFLSHTHTHTQMHHPCCKIDATQIVVVVMV